MNNISIYGGHNASISFLDSKNNYRIIELERLFKSRHFMLFDKSENEFIEIVKQVLKVADKFWNIKNDFETCAYGINGSSHLHSINKAINVKKIIQYNHHDSHAACAFYQSSYENSVIISFDGGGNDGVFNLYYGEKKNGLKKLNFNSSINLGHAYMLTGYPIKELKGVKGKLPYDLSIAGKLMGLVAYGKCNYEWLPHIINFYKQTNNWNLNQLGHQINLDLGINTIEGQQAYDFAATSQKAFEIIFLDLYEQIHKFCSNNKIDSTNICLTGGAALNVLLNEILIMKVGLKDNLFIPPNPDDGGLSLGQLFLLNQEKNQQDITFNGLPILDEEKFDFFLKKNKNKKVNYKELAEYIISGKIVGIIENDSEVGPRALGNRSIVCDPRFLSMKDTLNSKVKFREWFRPFAPVAREVDCNKYFELNFGNYENYKFMSFAPIVKNEYKNILPSITHNDGSSRLQIVKEKEESLFYKILNEFEKINPDLPSVILNTSFNIKGKPILSSYEDAFEVLNTTELDAVYSKGYLFEK